MALFVLMSPIDPDLVRSCGNAQLPRFYLQCEHLREDATLRQPTGMEPKSLLPGRSPHAAQLAFVVKAPDRPHAIANFVAEKPARRSRLSLVTRGQHDQVGWF